jgi:hypothetical protein
VLFGNDSGGEAWSLDILTADYLISGKVAASAMKWAWTYFSMTEKDTPRALEVDVSEARSTGALAAPDLAGKTAGFSYATGLIGLIARDEAADKVWDQWANFGSPAPGEVTVGPYAVTGSLLSPSGLDFLINDRFAVQDATITRLDGSGSPIDAPKAVFSTRFVQTAAYSG